MSRRIPPWLAVALLLPLCCNLGGCVAAAAVAGVEATSDMVFGRGVADLGVSAVTGRDCSTVRLDKGLPYCAAREQLPAPPPFCTKTIGTYTCWRDPEAFVNRPHEVADTPGVTREQAKLITSRWPKSLNLGD